MDTGVAAGGDCEISRAVWVLGPNGDCVYAVAKNKDERLVATNRNIEKEREREMNMMRFDL